MKLWYWDYVRIVGWVICVRLLEGDGLFAEVLSDLSIAAGVSGTGTGTGTLADAISRAAPAATMVAWDPPETWSEGVHPSPAATVTFLACALVCFLLIAKALVVHQREKTLALRSFPLIFHFVLLFPIPKNIIDASQMCLEVVMGKKDKSGAWMNKVKGKCPSQCYFVMHHTWASVRNRFSVRCS